MCLLLANIGGATAVPADAAVTLDGLTCEWAKDPLGIGTKTPRLSWKLRSNRTNETQRAYQIQAASSLARLTNDAADLWDSGTVASDQSVLVPWRGRGLDSRSQVYWQVRVWDRDGEPGPWSQAAHFELGILHPQQEWLGKWITDDQPRHDIMQSVLSEASWIHAGTTATQSVAVRRVISLPKDAVVRSAAVDAAGDGLLTIYVNGQATRQGSSSRTAPLHADARTQLKPGRNVVAIGGAAVRNAIRRDRNQAGRNAIAAHLTVELASGQRMDFDSGADWKAATSPSGDWYQPDFDDTNWPAATVLGAYAAEPSKYCDNTIGPGRYLRSTFTARGGIAKARLYATALGLYEASINGRPVSDTRFDPGWTDYNQRVTVQTHDVTDLILPGRNAIGVLLGDGWYAGRVGWMGVAQYGSHPSFSAQLEITYNDGSRETIVSDESWRAVPGEVVGSDLQWGEILDARRHHEGWNLPGFDDAHWPKVSVVEHDVVLSPQCGPPVRPLLELTPKRIWQRGDKWMVDLGQNIVGVMRLRAKGAAGTAITLRHAEILAEDGSLYTESLRTALATDTFILSGTAEPEAFEPHFTFHGFRYVEISGYPGVPTTADVKGIVLGSDTPESGTWSCSDTNLNRLYQNIVWGQRGNFLSVPTDCPQRDERMGWMGDALVFAPTAARNAEVAGFFTKWMQDVNEAQGTNGEFRTVTPRANQRNSWPVWGDAGVVIPWVMYTAYGDTAFLADNYDHMVRWVEYCRNQADRLILSGGVGDHLAPSMTPPTIVDTAFFANSARIVSRAARLLGKSEDEAKYDKLSTDIAAAFNRQFVGTDGSITAESRGRRIGNTQTAYILALRFDLLPQALRPTVADRLALRITEDQNLTTGFVGVGLICPTLTDIGRSDLAWQLVFNDTYPSWLFSVKNGATTIWERWDGWTPDRGFQASSMNSFNHYSFGSVGEWFYSGAAGIQIDEQRPGYKHFYLRPQFTTRLKYVEATQESPYGQIGSRWDASGEEFIYEAIVPPNSTATLSLPGTADRNLPPGQHRFVIDRNLVR